MDDPYKKQIVLQSKSEMYYYMIEADSARERRYWANLYIAWIMNED